MTAIGDTIKAAVDDYVELNRTADELLAEVHSLPRQQRRRAMSHIAFLGVSDEMPAETRRERRNRARQLTRKRVTP